MSPCKIYMNDAEVKGHADKFSADLAYLCMLMLLGCRYANFVSMHNHPLWFISIYFCKLQFVTIVPCVLCS